VIARRVFYTIGIIMSNTFEFQLNIAEKTLLCKALKQFSQVKKDAYNKALNSFPNFLPVDFGIPEIKVLLAYVADTSVVGTGDVAHFELIVLESDQMICLRSLEELSRRQSLALIEARSVLPQNKIAAFRRSDFDMDEIEALLERFYKMLSLF
jgi:hypothetical protein